MTENLNLTVAVGLLDSKYDQKPDQVGDNLINSPDATIGVGADYSMLLGGGNTLTFRSDFTYKSKIHNNSENTSILTQSSVRLLDASIRWTGASERIAVTIGGKNLTDEEYLITGFFQPGVGYSEGVFARPAQWYLSLRYDY